MNINPFEDEDILIHVQPVDAQNWRGVARLQVSKTQQKFVADPCYYLALCNYGGVWHPLAVQLGDQVIGFLMWGIDPADEACWLGGILIDQQHQRQGFGRRAVQAAIDLLNAQHGYQQFAVSYAPNNPASRLYQSLGFVETGELEEDELVARLTRPA